MRCFICKKELYRQPKIKIEIHCCKEHEKETKEYIEKSIIKARDSR